MSPSEILKKEVLSILRRFGHEPKDDRNVSKHSRALFLFQKASESGEFPLLKEFYDKIRKSNGAPYDKTSISPVIWDDFNELLSSQGCLVRFRVRRVKNRIRARVITERTGLTKEKIKLTEKEELRTTRFFPKGFTFPILKYIYGNKVAMISLGKNVFGVITEDKEIAKGEAIAFELMWKTAQQ
ncbi:MAG TPA: hypothetical protein VJI75_02115 [Candidatus Nanoarchaeia archaeon]|nr:hypothetical protein [Candidatus Nanoarchaeia archaeon]